MKGYVCDKCGTELLYEQVHGIRIKREVKHKGTSEYYYSAYCSVCDKYITTKK